MDGITIIIILGSLGFITMGLVMLNNKKLREILTSSNIYKDTDKYINFNGKFNIFIGVIGLVLGVIAYFLGNNSKYIIYFFIAIMLISTIVQKLVVKKYKS